VKTQPLVTPEPEVRPVSEPADAGARLDTVTPADVTAESKVAARDAFWRDAVEDVHGGQNSSTNTISADDTASLKRVDTTGEETTTIE
jgi:hypothetical protein